MVKKNDEGEKKKEIEKKEVPPRFELGSLDSESRVLTITPWDHQLVKQGKINILK